MNEFYSLIYGFIIGASAMSSIKDILKEKEIKKIKAEVKREWEKFGKLPEKCPVCGGGIKNIPAGISKRTGNPYKEFWVCENPECSFTCNKRGNRYLCNWDKIQKSKSRKTKKEEVQDTDEIDVKDIPF
jgi:uncharacterized protein with PIN domain